MNRGDIFLVTIPGRTPDGREIAKTRPRVVISIPTLNAARSSVVMLPLTSNGKFAPPIAISVPSAGKDSAAVCDQLLAVDKRHIGKQIEKLSAPDLDLVDESLKLLLGL